MEPILLSRIFLTDLPTQLNGGTLDGATLDVTSEVAHEDEDTGTSREGHPIDQSDKPRAGSKSQRKNAYFRMFL